MALPQNPLSSSDRQILETIKSQNAHLDAQTKVLHTLSSSIMSFKQDQRKEYNSLRNDIKEMQRDFFTGNAKGMSDIKKYFEKTKNNRPETSFNKEKDTDKGFFKTAINKLFGPSKYQQKMIDEISMLREVTEIQATDIGFIKRQYEEGPRARERELLAQAIASKLDLGGGDGGGKGMLSMLGAGLISALGAIIGNIGSIITAAIAAGWALLKKLFDAWGSSRGLPGVDTPDRGKGKEGGKTIPPEEPGRVPTPSAPTPSPGPGGSSPKLPSPGTPSLPSPEAPRLPGPESTGKTIEEKMRERAQQRAGGVSDATPKGPSKPGMGRLGVRGMLGPLAAALEFLFYTGGIDPNEDAELKKRREKSPTIGLMPDQTDAETARLLRQNTIETVKNEEDLNGALKRVIDSMMEFENKAEEIAEAMGKAIMQGSVSMLNNLGEINLSNGQSINLMPNLGTATAEVLDQVYEETKDLAKMGMEAAQPIINNIVNQMSQGGSSTPLPMVAAAAVATGAGISTYHRRMGRIR